MPDLRKTTGRQIEVSAAIFSNERDEILICRRGPGGNCAFLWGVPRAASENPESRLKTA